MKTETEMMNSLTELLNEAVAHDNRTFLEAFAIAAHLCASRVDSASGDKELVRKFARAIAKLNQI